MYNCTSEFGKFFGRFKTFEMATLFAEALVKSRYVCVTIWEDGTDYPIATISDKNKMVDSDYFRPHAEGCGCNGCEFWDTAQKV